MADRRLDLPRLDVRSLPGPENVLRRELDNGIVVLARENCASPSVVVQGFLPAGALFDPPGKEGLADLTAAALMQGTEHHTFQEIYDQLESLGASLSIGASKHSASFQGKALAEDLGVLLGLLAEVLTSPTFPRAEVARLRAEKLTSLTLRDQDTNARAQMAFSELAYPGHPYRIPSDGYRETVAALRPADLRRFHARHYGPRGMVIAVVGAVPAEAAVEAVAAALGAWRNARQPEPPAVPPAEALAELVRREVPLAGKIQSDIVLGAPGPSRFDPDFLAAALGNNILGRFGMMGRIGEAVRERAGLAYYAYSTVAGGPGPGPWSVIAGVNPDNVERAIDLIRREIRRFTRRRVTQEELEDNQSHFIGRLPLQLESNEGVAGALVHVERYRLGLDYYQRYPERVLAVTRDQVLEVARRFLDADRLAIAVAGPPREVG